jgi:hypothetical protein
MASEEEFKNKLAASRAQKPISNTAAEESVKRIAQEIDDFGRVAREILLPAMKAAKEDMMEDGIKMEVIDNLRALPDKAVTLVASRSKITLSKARGSAATAWTQTTGICSTTFAITRAGEIYATKIIGSGSPKKMKLKKVADLKENGADTIRQFLLDQFT